MQMQPNQLCSSPIFPYISHLADFQMIANKRKAQVAPAVCAHTSLFAKTSPELTINGYFACAYSLIQQQGIKRGLTFSPNGTKQHP